MVYHVRLVKDSGALFVLLWNLLVFSYQKNALTNIINIVTQNRHTIHLQPWQYTLVSAVLLDFLPKLLYPLAGWLADAKLGRYKVMRYSLWIMWVGSVLLMLASILRYVLWLADPVDNHSIIKYTMPISALIYIFNAVGIAGYHVNFIPFGMDQMEGASGEQIAGFVHWYFWTMNFNIGMIVRFAMQSLTFYCDKDNKSPVDFSENRQRFDLYILLIQMTFLTAAICLDFLFSSKLHKDAKIHDPVKKVKEISAFILKHGRAVGHRKAYTFTYDTPPSRSDFAKQSYGGPFEDDAVEDVNAFWRLLVFLLAIGIGVFLMLSGYYNYESFFNHTRHRVFHLPHCTFKYLITSFVSVMTFAICIPFYEFLIYPFFRNRIPRMTVRIGLGMIVLLLGLSLLVAMDIKGHLSVEARNTSICMFSDDHTIHTSGGHFLMILVIVIVTVGEMLVMIPALEFMCAQSPYSMRGLIIGILYMVYGISVGFLSLFLMAFSVGFQKHPARFLSCGTWYFVGVVTLGCVGFILYIGVARWYKERQRGGQKDINHQTILENYFES